MERKIEKESLGCQGHHAEGLPEATTKIQVERNSIYLFALGQPSKRDSFRERLKSRGKTRPLYTFNTIGGRKIQFFYINSDLPRAKLFIQLYPRPHFQPHDLLSHADKKS